MKKTFLSQPYGKVNFLCVVLRVVKFTRLLHVNLIHADYNYSKL